MARVGFAIEQAVACSFLEDKSRATDAETRRRTAMCVEQFKIMRHDMKWSIPKICDLMVQSLRAELDAGSPASFIDAMAKRGWVRVEQEGVTEAGIVIPR